MVDGLEPTDGWDQTFFMSVRMSECAYAHHNLIHQIINWGHWEELRMSGHNKKVYLINQYQTTSTTTMKTNIIVPWKAILYICCLHNVEWEGDDPMWKRHVSRNPFWAVGVTI